MKWEVVIGLEAHAQLTTRSKIFSGAGTTFGASANSQACGVDIALPGTLPVLNQDAVRNAIKFGLSVGANIAPRSVFARKNYFYPDLPKGYQISQYELPVVQGGSLTVQVGEHSKTVRLTRAHLEEDAGKSLHEDFHGMTGIDLNRAGTPLLEIVTEPDMRSAAEAVAYAKALHGLLRWIEVCDGNMQEGSYRCDANVSVRPLGQEVYGTRCEIKNLNSFRFLEKAIDYEVRRQIELIEDGGKVVQETRLYDPDQDETRSMRSKEDAQDYRYFPDPDLLPLVIDADWIEQVRMSMPELPASKRARYISELGLSEYDAGVLTTSLELSAYFESAIKQLPGQAKLCANWIMVDLLGRLNREELEIGQSPVSAERMAGLVRRVADGTVSGKMAKEIFEALWQGEGDADQIIERRG
ncbi:MAG: Asp-tRNA(Asn)/Glu-tRNA(Gln) amidotransferase subunit GatB, partial [Betaproteobacteria bacterium]|nr:Asp-tRNA(Asn)/Glu-tRNA(Gln) amidotransferase subunit GatB [Betaproteobacteria bacterium]